MADPVSDFINFFKKRKAAFLAAFVTLLALLAALGTGFQNATAVAELLISGTTLTMASAWGLGAAIGGIASTMVNFCLNIELLESFWDRLTGRKPSLPGVGKRIQWGLGIGVFVITGILFGLTAISVGATGGLAIAAIVAGVFVTLAMIPQELETWMQSFDNPVALTVDKAIYDIKNTEDKTKIPELLTTLKIELEKVFLIEKLKKLKEKLAQEAEKNQEKEGKEAEQAAVKVLKNIIVYLEKHEFDLTILNQKCEEIGNEVLQKKLKLQLSKLEKDLNKKKAIIKQIPTWKNAEISEEEITQILQQLDAFKTQLLENFTEQKISIPDAIKRWWRDLTPGRFAGLIISLGNVMALSLLFTVGLTTFLTGVGVAALPALIIGFSVAFTFGAFTEFYFYHYFLADFCDHIVYRWKELINAPNWGAGILLVVTNGAVNGVLAYFGVLLLGGLLAAAGIAAPPLLPLAIVAGIFAGVASLLLGSDFWIKSAQRFFTFGKQQPVLNKENELDEVISEKESFLPNKLSRKETKQQKEAYQWMFAPAQEYCESFNNYSQQKALVM